MVKIVKISREEAQRRLSNVPEEYVFWCCDGRVLRNMRELGETLNTMTDEVFAYHSNAEKHDFAEWVRNIIQDQKLARDLDKSHNQNQAAKRVAKRVAFLSGKLF